jgi:TolA-binding protein
VEATINSLKDLGPIGIALIVLLIMSALMGRERKASQAQMTVMTTRHDAELKRINDAHDEELGELKTDIIALRNDIRELRAEMEQERAARRTAEEESHRLRMGLNP